ncbi:MAG TPA: sigma-70 family RNA polymerase sigma factor [Polyangiaceae bacterium]
MIPCAEPRPTGSKAHLPDEVTPTIQFQSFYRRHFDAVTRFVLRFGIDRDDAEDLVQRVFIVVYRQLEAGEAIERPEAYLRGIALRIVREHFRWWRVRKAAQWLVELSWAGRSEDELTPERHALSAESFDRVQRVLYRMSQKLREAIVLLDIEDLSPREASELLDVPMNTLRSRRALARDEFKRLWGGMSSQGDPNGE